ncbi:MAG TPA: group 1 truncated hemoglobin [Tepidisphaeraceae bacterium]|jgi:hemoglobin|nr:group 1 truncated hemoglobin [Tepidisphaeraceae bacterium]
MGNNRVVSTAAGVVGLLSVLAVGFGCASNAPKPLYDRIGGDAMIQVIVEDFVGKAAGDPRVNFTRKGTGQEWDPTPANVGKLKEHLVEFFDAATGGPQEYRGRDMRSVHAGMQITNAQFDAIEVDLQSSLNKFDVPAQERSELMAIVEGTRKDIVEVK